MIHRVWLRYVIDTCRDVEAERFSEAVTVVLTDLRATVIGDIPAGQTETIVANLLIPDPQRPGGPS